MLHGELVTLRAVRRDDVPVLHVLHEDVEQSMSTDPWPWRPVPVEQALAAYDKRIADGGERPDDAVTFAVETAVAVGGLAAGTLVGSFGLYQVDPHNRAAAPGYELLPAARGHGLGRDALRAVCDYGFRVRGLHRLQITTLADNAASVRIAESVGFRREGILRDHAWVGRWADELVLGLLADEWADGRDRRDDRNEGRSAP